MRRTPRALARLLTVATLVMGVVGQVGPAIPASAETSSARTPVTLKGRTVLTGSRSKMIRVRLTKAVMIERLLAPNRADITVKGRGRFVGFALVQDTPKFDGISLIGGRLPKDSGLGNFYFSPRGLDNASGSGRLPAGAYRLYLLADGSPVEVTFDLKGLQGTTRFNSPATIADYEVATPGPRLVDGANNVYGSGADGTLSGPGLLFDFLWTRHDAHVNTQYQFCLYKGGERGPSPYAPGCPTSDEFFSLGDGVMSAGSYTSSFYGGGAPFEADRYGQGFTFESAAAVDDIGYVALWLTF